MPACRPAAGAVARSGRETPPSDVALDADPFERDSRPAQHADVAVGRRAADAELGGELDDSQALRVGAEHSDGREGAGDEVVRAVLMPLCALL